jgi:TonB family protein
MTASGSVAVSPGLSDLLTLSESRRDRLLVALVLAASAHSAIALLPAEPPRAEPRALAPVEMELPLPAEPEPEPESPQLDPESESETSTDEPPPTVARAATPPAAAAAPAVLTAIASAASDPAQPFDFTSDPNSKGFGFGVVVAGGRHTRAGKAGATKSGRGSKPAPAVTRVSHNTRPKSDLTPASDLSRTPRLSVTDPCSGYFPSSAAHDAATVSVRVVVNRQGRVTSASVMHESVPGEGFASAAKRCMLSQTFSPALDRSGKVAATAVSVNVRFRR